MGKAAWRWAYLGAALASLLHARPGFAFDYAEHAHISRRALDLLQANGAPHGREAAVLAYELTRALATRHMCATAEGLAGDQPPGCFTLADIPALSADHSASPILTKWRWFNDCLPSHPQSVLATALPSVVAALNTNRRTPEEERINAPDYDGFLAYIRKFAPPHWPASGYPSNTTLVEYDDDYLVLAERGHPHFHPGLAAPSPALASERERRRYAGRLRSKPVNTAYAWYADLHAGALRLARASWLAPSEDRALIRAVATFLELNAWHYLEDMVASGHMVGSPSLSNGSLSATHDYWCAEGIHALVPGPLCDVVRARHWESPLRGLADACALPRGTTVPVYGDHQLLLHHSGPALWNDSTYRVTEDWAVALVAHSFESVIDAAFVEGPPSGTECEVLASCVANRVNDKAYTWDIEHGACGADPDQQFYRCMWQWWEGDDPYESSHERAIVALYEDGKLDTLGMIPIPAPAERARYPEKISFSGNAVEVSATATGYHSSTSTGVRLGGTLGYSLVVPASLFPVELGAYAAGDAGDATSGDGAPRPRAALGVRARVSPPKVPRLVFGFDVEGGAVIVPAHVSFAGDLAPIGWKLVDANGALLLVQGTIGYAESIGARGGLSLSFLR